MTTIALIKTLHILVHIHVKGLVRNHTLQSLCHRSITVSMAASRNCIDVLSDTELSGEGGLRSESELKNQSNCLRNPRQQLINLCLCSCRQYVAMRSDGRHQ